MFKLLGGTCTFKQDQQMNPNADHVKDSTVRKVLLIKPEHHQPRKSVVTLVFKKQNPQPMLWHQQPCQGEGVYPDVDPFGRPFDRNYEPGRAALAGTRIMGPYVAVLEGVQADQDFLPCSIPPTELLQQKTMLSLLRGDSMDFKIPSTGRAERSLWSLHQLQWRPEPRETQAVKSITMLFMFQSLVFILVCNGQFNIFPILYIPG